MSKKTIVKKGNISDTSFNEDAAADFFASLADCDDPETISMEGISKLCDLLNIDPSTDVRVLVLMWKLGAVSKPGSISKNEFLTGMRKFSKSDANGLIAILPSLDPGFLDRAEFRGKFVLRYESSSVPFFQISTGSSSSFQGKEHTRP